MPTVDLSMGTTNKFSANLAGCDETAMDSAKRTSGRFNAASQLLADRRAAEAMQDLQGLEDFNKTLKAKVDALEATFTAEQRRCAKLVADIQNEAVKHDRELSDAEAVMAVLAGSLNALNVENQRLKKDIKETKCQLKAAK